MLSLDRCPNELWQLIFYFACDDGVTADSLSVTSQRISELAKPFRPLLITLSCSEKLQTLLDHLEIQQPLKHRVPRLTFDRLCPAAKSPQFTSNRAVIARVVEMTRLTLGTLVIGALGRRWWDCRLIGGLPNLRDLILPDYLWEEWTRPYG